MDDGSEELKDTMYSWLVSEIEEAQSAGVEVRVDGVRYSLSDVDKLRGVMENRYYMKSYTGDERGKIVQIDFEHIVSV